MKQVANSILMIRPVAFRMNEQTIVNNHFQKELREMLPSVVNAKAQQEFDAFVEKLRAVGVNVVVVDDLLETDTPDSIFPNNWVSFHENGDVVLYPMFAENRRAERREDVLDILEQKGFVIENIVDFTSAEEENMFLEGTGSMILDRANAKAYCALSPRANEELFIEFCEDFDCAPVIFEAYHTVDGRKELVYHTNVMMCVADKYVVICLDSITNPKEKEMIVSQIHTTGKKIIEISFGQMNHFAGNMLQVHNNKGQKFLVMSSQAYLALNKDQIDEIEKFNPIIHSDIKTIETNGGGSARCMMAEVFLPLK